MVFFEDKTVTELIVPSNKIYNLFKDKYYFTHPEDFSSIFSILVKYGKSTSKYILSKGEIYE